MILKTYNKKANLMFNKISNTLIVITVGFFLLLLFNFSTCKYSFKDGVSIPQEVKTFRVNWLENRARYVNPQLSPQLTEKLKFKIIGNTRLRQSNDDNAHYDISGYINDYTVTTTGISNKAASTNRLNVGFHLIFKNKLDEKKNFEADVSTTYDFNANLSLSQAEATLNNEILKNTVDAIFNKIFSNW
jgi:Lipopolysaccharide-assembly